VQDSQALADLIDETNNLEILCADSTHTGQKQKALISEMKMKN